MRLNRLLEFADSFPVSSLIYQYPTEIEVRLAISGFVVNRLLILSCRLGEDPLAFKELSQVVVSVGVIRIDVNRFPKGILRGLIFFGTHQKHSVIVVGLRRTGI